ncbi:ATP-dependent DNA helicase [Puniceicoccales bacterium CK1056]|uniref:ATP-dependent DNA helicase n=1 Tax=Oceanipulchritudo coccoides TaxID=2706888 RepID=A0A6B2M2N8_9BACT|nr:ATP-dependent DNA helicase [Oceanipulchritudo coccoides]NDV63281.1 ATP-dependent DNA helicase [Oceanipulchritudo coccoides]
MCFLPLPRIPLSPHHPDMIGLNDAFLEGSVAKIPAQETWEAVARIFKKEGTLQKKMQLEHRPQQEQMALRTLEAWQRDQPVFFEAGTGVGKSLAYLIPGIMQAVSAERPLVVSTHTIALQEQIETKDLSLCRKLFQSDPILAHFAKFRHAVLLGRGNYLCGTRLKQALKTRTELFPSNEQKELERIADWAQTTTTGLRQELSPEPLPEVWDWVQADGHSCNPRNCSPKSCFFRKAREAVRDSNLIIVNHSLLFALLAAGHFPTGDVPGILFPEDFMVIDEAHTLPAIATEYFGLQISGLGLRRQLLKLYHPHKRKSRGLLVKNGDPGLRSQVMILTDEVEGFFESVKQEHLGAGRPFRLRVADWHENSLDIPLRDLIHGICKCESRMEEGAERDELEGVRRRLQAYREGINEALQISDPESVYWIEGTGQQGKRVHLRSAPLEVAGPLRERLFERNTGLLLTSATLAEGPDMDSFKRKVGAPEADSEQVASPFDYPLQMEILIHEGAPGPSSEDGSLNTKFLEKEILRLACEVKGGSLVLFTSYRDLLAVDKGLRPQCSRLGRPLFSQGTGMGRSELLTAFRETGNGILLGTDSFWTGVDVPGPALSQVIITRLPFENPSHPIAEARGEKCREEGRSAFSELTLPAALVKFRQGLGRLIRNQTDEGRLAILDSRILSKPYGRLFLDVLPHSQYKRIS